MPSNSPVQPIPTLGGRVGHNSRLPALHAIRDLSNSQLTM